MATTLYLRDAASLVNPGADLEKELLPTRGAASVTKLTNTVGGPTAGVQVTNGAGGTPISWYSRPLKAVTISGQITANIRALESAAQANTGMQVTIDRVDNNGNFIANILDTERGTELTTADAANNWSATPGAGVALAAGDRIKVTVKGNDATGVNMGSGRTFTVSYDGPTAAAAGDSFITFTETLVEMLAVLSPPAGSTWSVAGDAAQEVVVSPPSASVWSALASLGVPGLNLQLGHPATALFSAGDENKLPKSSFETDLSGWTKVDSNASATWTRDTVEFLDGVASSKVVQATAGENDWLEASVAVIAGQVYTVSAWVKCDDFQGAAFGNQGLLLVFDNNVVPTGTAGASISAATGGWIRLSVTRVAAPGDVNLTVRLYLPKGTIYWDAVQVERAAVASVYVRTDGAAATRALASLAAAVLPFPMTSLFSGSDENLHLNSSAEAAILGTIEQWIGSAGAPVRVTTDSLFEAASVELTGMTSTYCGVQSPTTMFTTVPGQRYVASVYFKPASTATYHLDTGNGASDWNGTGPSVVCTAGQWTRLEASGVADRAGNIRWAVWKEGGGTFVGETVRLDGFQLERGAVARPYLGTSGAVATRALPTVAEQVGSVPAHVAYSALADIATGAGGPLNLVSPGGTSTWAAGASVQVAVRESEGVTAGLGVAATVRMEMNRTNQVINSGFETDTAGWVAMNAAARSRDTTEAHSGAASMKVVTTGATADEGAEVDTAVGGGGSYSNMPVTFSVWLKGTGDVYLELSDSWTGTRSATITLTSTWTRYSVSKLSQTPFPIIARIATLTAQAVTFWADDAQIEKNLVASPNIDTDGAAVSRFIGAVQESAAAAGTVATSGAASISSQLRATPASSTWAGLASLQGRLQAVPANASFSASVRLSLSLGPVVGASAFSAQAKLTESLQSVPAHVQYSASADFQMGTLNLVSPAASSTWSGGADKLTVSLISPGGTVTAGAGGTIGAGPVAPAATVVYSSSVTVARQARSPAASAAYSGMAAARLDIFGSSATVTFTSFTYTFVVPATMRPVATFTERSVSAGITPVERDAGLTARVSTAAITERQHGATIVEVEREATIV